MVALDSKDVLERGDAAPDFELRGTDGETYTIADFESYDALLVVFTCNHCPYAKANFEEMNRLADEFDSVAVVGINSNDETAYPDDDFEGMVDLVEDGTIQWDAYLRDEDQSTAADYGAMCTPDPFLFVNTARKRSLLAAEDGRFRLAYHGRLTDATDPDAEPTDREMHGHIDDLLDDGPVSDDFTPSRGCSIKWRDGNEPDYWDV